MDQKPNALCASVPHWQAWHQLETTELCGEIARLRAVGDDLLALAHSWHAILDGEGLIESGEEFEKALDLIEEADQALHARRVRNSAGVGILVSADQGVEIRALVAMMREDSDVLQMRLDHAQALIAQWRAMDSVLAHTMADVLAEAIRG